MSQIRRPVADVYPVGLLSDLQKCRGQIRHGRVPVRKAVGELWRHVRRNWRRRNYWNGYLAEADNVGHAGHGWTRGRALASLDRLVASRVWMCHDLCGTVRLGSLVVRRQYCVTCHRDTSLTQWSVAMRGPLPPLRYPELV